MVKNMSARRVVAVEYGTGGKIMLPMDTVEIKN